MHIEIKERLSPFSHTPGIACLIPLTTSWLEAYPVLLSFHNGNLTEKLQWELKGFCKNFLVQQNLEKGFIEVSGEFPLGYIRYRISAEKKNLFLCLEKSPKEGLFYSLGGKRAKLLPKEKHCLPFSVEAQVLFPFPMRLSMGVHKSQDWDLILRRQDLSEIFPFWFAIGQLVPPQNASEKTSLLLRECEELILGREKTKLSEAFLRVFQAAFKGIFVPLQGDEHHLGLFEEELAQEKMPFLLLEKGKDLILSLFFQGKNTHLKLLPCLPPSLPAGCLTGLSYPSLGTFDLEWSKKLLRRVVFISTFEGELFLELQSSLESFRVREERQDRGRFQKASEPLIVKRGKIYWLDRFQK